MTCHTAVGLRRVRETRNGQRVWSPTPLRSAEETSEFDPKRKGKAMAKNTICLWYDKDAVVDGVDGPC